MNTLRACVVIAAFFFFLSSPAFGMETSTQEKSWTFSFYFENDLFTGSDQNYTNGVKLSWMSPDLRTYEESGSLPEFTLPAVRFLPFVNEPESIQRNISLAIGQSMYTPEEISRSDLIIDDRPYAGWTYLAIGFHSRSVSKQDSLEFQMGLVGPESFAEQAQTIVHEIGGYQKPNGWDNQLKNEPGLEVIYERKVRLWRHEYSGGFGSDLIAHLGGALGNVYTYGNAGMVGRIGWNIPLDFGTALIRPAGDTNAPLGGSDPRFSSIRKLSLHLFAGVDVKGVLRDIFLDGNTFTGSHSVDKKNLVADFVTGISFILWKMKFSLSHVLRTKEFCGQKQNHQRFGSVNLSFSY